MSPRWNLRPKNIPRVPVRLQARERRVLCPALSGLPSHRWILAIALYALIFVVQVESGPVIRIAEPGLRLYAMNAVVVADDEKPLSPGNLAIAARGWDGTIRVISTMHLDAASHTASFWCYLDPAMASLVFISDDIEQRSGIDRKPVADDRSSAASESTAPRPAARGEFRLSKAMDPQAALMALLPEPARRIGWSRRAFTPSESAASETVTPWRGERRELTLYMEDFVHSLKPKPAWVSLAILAVSIALISIAGSLAPYAGPSMQQGKHPGSWRQSRLRLPWLIQGIAMVSGLLIAAVAPGKGNVYQSDIASISFSVEGIPVLHVVLETPAADASRAGSVDSEAAGSTELQTAGTTIPEAAKNNADKEEIPGQNQEGVVGVHQNPDTADLSAFALEAPGARRVALEDLLQHPGTARIRFGSPQPSIIMEGSTAYLDADGFVAGWVLR